METRPRVFLTFDKFAGAGAQTLDHCQVLAPDAFALCAFYGKLGFRSSEYIAHGDKLLGSFMYRKGTCLDLAVIPGEGPRLHHFAYIVPETHHVIEACDLAGRFGYASSVERGPGRHGPSGVLFVYIRDPDGHRIELFVNHYQTIDVEIEPVRWEGAALNTNVRWGLPAVSKWYFEASVFENTPLKRPEVMPDPETLEKYAQSLLAK